MCICELRCTITLHYALWTKLNFYNRVRTRVTRIQIALINNLQLHVHKRVISFNLHAGLNIILLFSIIGTCVETYAYSIAIIITFCDRGNASRPAGEALAGQTSLRTSEHWPSSDASARFRLRSVNGHFAPQINAF